MVIAVRLLGLDLLSIEITTEPSDDGPYQGDCTTTPIGFAPDTHGHDWQRGVER